MKYYTFLPQFHPAILEGVKHSTIRGKAKVKPGERFALRHWTGKPYHSKMGFLGTAVCSEVYDITLYRDDSGLGFEITLLPDDPVPAFMSDLKQLARMEGFESLCDMYLHFNDKNGLPFKGVLTIWDPRSFIPGDPNAEHSSGLTGDGAISLGETNGRR